MDDTWNFEQHGQAAADDDDDNEFQDDGTTHPNNHDHDNHHHHEQTQHRHHEESVVSNSREYSQPIYNDDFGDSQSEDDEAHEMIQRLVRSQNEDQQSEDSDDYPTTFHSEHDQEVPVDHTHEETAHSLMDTTAHHSMTSNNNNNLLSTSLSLHPTVTTTTTTTTSSSSSSGGNDPSHASSQMLTSNNSNSSVLVIPPPTTDSMKSPTTNPTTSASTTSTILSPSLSNSHVPPKPSSIPSRSSAAMITRGTEFLMMEDQHNQVFQLGMANSGSTFLPPPLGVPVGHLAASNSSNLQMNSPPLPLGGKTSAQLQTSQVFSHTTQQNSEVSSLTPIQPSTSQTPVPASPKKVRIVQSKDEKRSTRSNNEASEDNSNLEVLSTAATSTTVFSPAYMHQNLMHSFYMGDPMMYPDMQHWMYPYGYAPPPQPSFWNYGFHSYPHGPMHHPNGEHHHLMGGEEQEMLSSHHEINQESDVAQQQHLVQQTQQFSADVSNAGEGTIYVNPKQYHRILKRRIARAKLEHQMKNAGQKEKASYKYNSRHEWAKKRARGPGGRFLSKKEKEKLEQAESEKGDASTAETLPNIENTFDSSLKTSRSTKKKRETAPLSSSVVPPPMLTTPNMLNLPLVGPPQHIAYPKNFPTMMEDFNMTTSSSSHHQ
ncbi:hypothetical protein FDP41_000645 [Naegleria fowleri]|uniref:Nuclear transcription factor Y subunit n=1 Tax=Naegleria fowleri TaxID=5763 RepID=A0A6A5CAH9_NAEFO|nr:uncharacterized protein FDP41_000645 [Naegleria fowleri]KAF0984746.1 hypothetical protein FDP41_000645 [Naegleria fowleri]CAG4719331.1 unnamed protein product [Naegleria fowleri]